MAGITWLHLSDWHQGRKEDFDRKIVCDALTKDIRNRTNISPDLEKIDFIIFSGDVAYSGKAEEYEAAQKYFFDHVLDATGLSPNRLFIVPGNHDIDRNAFDLLPATLLDPFESNEQVKDWLANKKKRDLLLEPFEAFTEFVTPYTHQINPDYSCIRELEIDGKRVGLLGINSALMAGRNKNRSGEVDDYGKLIVGETQLYDALQKIKSSEVRIAVLHHPLNWLAEFEIARIKQLLQDNNGCHFILCGHQHRSEAYTEVTQLTGTKENCLVISAGSSYSNRDYHNGYNFVHINFETAKDKSQVTVYQRRWHYDESNWLQHGDPKSDIGSAPFQLPKKEPGTTPPNPTKTNLPDETQRQLKQHFDWLIPKIKDGLVVPFLGTDINLCDRPQDPNLAPKPWDWDINSEYPPTSVELATYLDTKHQYLEKIRCPLYDEETLPSSCPIRTQLVTRLDLQHVSQYFDIHSEGENKIKETIIKIAKLDKYTKPNKLYKLLAELPHRMDDKGYSSQIKKDEAGHATRYQLIVTTNFDSSLERAFIDANQSFDLVFYTIDENKNKCFIHQKFELDIKGDEQHRKVKPGKGEKISPGDANTYSYPFLNKRPVILKLYGSIDRLDNQRTNFAITEDNFIDYLGYSNSKLNDLLPASLLKKIRNGHILFLGYSLRYWHQRAILHHILERDKIEKGCCWAVHPKPDELDKLLWQGNNIDLVKISLDTYFEELNSRLEEWY